MTRHDTRTRRGRSPLTLLLALTVTVGLAGCGEGYQRKRAEMAVERGDVYGAADIYVELGEFEQAADAMLSVMDHYRAAELYEQAGNFQKAAESYKEIANNTKAAELYEKAGSLELAGDMLAADGRIPAARELYEKAESWAKVGQMLEQEGSFAEAATAYEKGGDFSGFGRMLEKADKPIEAAAAYEKGQNFRAATALYEAAEMWPEAARNAVALAERDNGNDAKLQAARMLVKTGEAERAAEFYDAALTQAKSFGNYAAVMDVSVESGKTSEVMDFLLDEAERLLNEGRAAVAAEAILAINDAPDEHFRKLKGAQKRRFGELAERMIKAVDELPEVPTIEGINQFIVYGTGVETFEFCQVTGAVLNKSEVPLAHVELEITLFQKDFDSFVAGQDSWGEVPEELAAKFEQQESGYRETIVLTDIAPGETREFSQRLGNTVPYKHFSHHIIKAEPAG